MRACDPACSGASRHRSAAFRLGHRMLRLALALLIEAVAAPRLPSLTGRTSGACAPPPALVRSAAGLCPPAVDPHVVVHAAGHWHARNLPAVADRAAARLAADRYSRAAAWQARRRWSCARYCRALIPSLACCCGGHRAPTSRRPGRQKRPHQRARRGPCGNAVPRPGVGGGGVDRQRARARLSGDRRSPSRPPVGAHDANLLLMIATEAKFGGGKQPVHDKVVLACTIVDELGATLGAEDKERRHLALTNAAWKLDEDLGPVVEGAQRSPSRRIALDRISEIEPGEVEPGVDRGGGFGDRIVPAQGD